MAHDPSLTPRKDTTMPHDHAVTFDFALGARVTGYLPDATCPSVGTIARQRVTYRDGGLPAVYEYAVAWDDRATLWWHAEADLQEESVAPSWP